MINSENLKAQIINSENFNDVFDLDKQRTPLEKIKTHLQKTHVEIWSKKKPKPCIIQPPTVMSKGSDPALLGKIRMVVEAIFEMGEAEIYIQKDNGIDYNGSVPRQVGVSRKVDTKDREREGKCKLQLTETWNRIQCQIRLS